MVKSRIGPHRRVVAQLTCGRESRRRMRRIVRAGVIGLVARVAQSAVERIVVVLVAIAALPRWHGMRAGQLEAGTGVVKRPVAPLHCVVASLTCRWETRGSVIHGRDRIRVVILMTRNACGARQVVVVIRMAIGTLPRRHRVCAGEREPRTAVIERRV